MNKLKGLIETLTSYSDEHKIEMTLRNISEFILRNYHLEYKSVKVYFTDIEMYYKNAGVYDDVTVHCDIRQTHFDEIYIHKHRSYKCFDVCISLGDYYLSFLVRGAIVNDIQYFRPSEVYDAIIATETMEILFDDAKGILRENLKPIDDKFVMFSSRYNLTNADWGVKQLRAVIDSTLIGKDIPKKEELAKSLLTGMEDDNAKMLCKKILGYTIKK